MRNKSKFNSFMIKTVMIFLLGIMILPFTLFAEGGIIGPPPPDSSGHNDMIVNDSLYVEDESSTAELSLMESLALNVLFLMVL